MTYFTNQVHRMDYPKYISKGWQIGSGPVESACKTVVGRRLKQTGARWKVRRRERMAALSCLSYSDYPR